MAFTLDVKTCHFNPTTPPLVLGSITDQYSLAPPTWGMRLGATDIWADVRGGCV